MDIACTVCGEPWELDTLHEMGDWTTDGVPITFAEARSRFERQGCAAFEVPHNSEGIGSLRAQASSMLFDLLGDDIDGVAAMMEDAEYMGMFE